MYHMNEPRTPWGLCQDLVYVSEGYLLAHPMAPGRLKRTQMLDRGVPQDKPLPQRIC